jgi:ferric-dicitrate binding protein FerR (iron transport regulator)
MVRRSIPLTRMPDSSPEPLIGAYFDGTLGPADAERVQAFLEETPSRRGFMAGVRAALRGEDIAKSPHDTATAAKFLVEKLQDNHVRPQDTELALTGRELGRQPRRRSVFKAHPLRRGASKGQTLRRSVWYGIASIALVSIAILAGWRGLASHVGGYKDTSVLTYVTGNGERANIILPDGNTVALNVASHLEVPADYADGDHTVRLTGEAMFTVLHHEGAPFAVLAGPTTTRVLGTNFVVRRYATDSMTTVAVHQGKVSVRSMVVMADRQVEIGRTGVPNTREVNPSLFSFATGVLMLDGVRLSDAIPELNRWYDADIRLGNPALANRMLMGDLPAGTVGEVQEVLELMFNVRVLREGRVLTLFPRA